MQRWPVESSQIASVGYDAGKQLLQIEFKRNGAVYNYGAVPPEVHAELIASSSVGKYFNANIRDKYAAMRLTEAEGKVHASTEAQAAAEAASKAPEGSQENTNAAAASTDDSSSR